MRCLSLTKTVMCSALRKFSVPNSALHTRTRTSVGTTGTSKFRSDVLEMLNQMHFYSHHILDYPLLNFSLLFVCVCVCVYVCVCNFCSEEGKSSPLVDGWKWSSACQQGIVDICKGQQAYKPHHSLSLLILSPFFSFSALSFSFLLSKLSFPGGFEIKFRFLGHNLKLCKFCTI